MPSDQQRKRFLLCANPVSGRGRSLAWARQARAMLQCSGIEAELAVSEYAGHTWELARDLDLSQYTGLCVIGGDGSIRELIHGLRQRAEPADLPIGLIASGTGNSLHQDLGIQDPTLGIQRMVAGTTRTVDLLQVKLDDQLTYCVNLVGVAAAAMIGRRAESLRCLGRSRYFLATLWEVFRAKRLRIQLEADGVAVDDSFLLVVGCNTRYCGWRMMLAPQASLGDGLVDLVCIQNASRMQMLRLFSHVQSGAHVLHPSVRYLKTPRFRLKPESPCHVNLDGNVSDTLYSTIDVEAIPRGLVVYA